MRISDDLLRAFAYRFLPCVPSDWGEWLRKRLVLRQILGKLSINCVLDVGAHRGEYGTLLRKIGYRGWIISFEPVRDSYEFLKSVASSHPPWRVYPYGLGVSNERRGINVTEETSFSSFLTPLEESQTRFPKNRVKSREDVDVRRLDSILEECLTNISSPRIYLKLDTQGFELSVMEGAQSTLPRILALQTEVSVHDIYQDMHKFVDTVAKFQAAGFEVIDFVTVNRDIDQLCVIDTDCFMARKPEWEQPAARKSQIP
jgi:FkbM family methyltransferase